MLVNYKASLVGQAIRDLAASGTLTADQHNSLMVMMASISDAMVNPAVFGGLQFPDVNSRLGPGTAVGLENEPYLWWKENAGLTPAQQEARMLYRAAQEVIRILRNFIGEAPDSTQASTQNRRPGGLVSVVNETPNAIPVQVFGAAENSVIPEDCLSYVGRVKYAESVDRAMLSGAANWIIARGRQIAASMKANVPVPVAPRDAVMDLQSRNCILLADHYVSARKKAYLVSMITALASLVFSVAMAALTKPDPALPAASIGMVRRQSPGLPG